MCVQNTIPQTLKDMYSYKNTIPQILKDMYSYKNTIPQIIHKDICAQKYNHIKPQRFL